jgi:hypothetical protein
MLQRFLPDEREGIVTNASLRVIPQKGPCKQWANIFGDETRIVPRNTTHKLRHPSPHP